MNTEYETDLDIFIGVLDKLTPSNRRDVLDVAIYLIWRQTGKPAPFWSVVRGWWKHSFYKIGGKA